MRTLFIALLLANSLFAVTLLNQNIYERENRVDLMLSFDAPFEGIIRKSVAPNGRIDIKLSGVQVVKPFKKILHNDIVDSIAITGFNKNGALVKIIPADGTLNVDASKTIDGFGLRLRIVPKPISGQSRSNETAVTGSAATDQVKTSKGLDTLKSSDTLPGWRYWTVLAIMLILLLVLWIVKRRKFSGRLGAGWLMPKAAGANTYPEGAIIRYQKPLDPQNRLLLLEWGGRQYLMVVGNSNLLLDTFSEEKIEDPESFTSLFEANKKQLDHFLKENHPDAYEAFKANASRDDHI